MVPNVAGSSPVDRPSLHTHKDTVSIFEALIYGILQGVTEFLPVSSSGHLILAQRLIGIKQFDSYIPFDLACHLGTLCAILIVYAAEIQILLTHNTLRVKQVILGTLPLLPLALFIKPIKAQFAHPDYLGLYFLTTAAILYAGIKLSTPRPEAMLFKNRWRDPLIIGFCQSIAILPGISRSGTTISGARLLGWRDQEAVTFSFLLAIPAILGGCIFEGASLLLKNAPKTSVEPLFYIVGFITSFFVGWIALLLLKRLAAKEQFMYFVWYCFGLGLLVISYD